MKFSVLSPLALFLGAADAKFSLHDARAKRQLNRSFMAAMHGDPKLGKAPRRKTKRSPKLDKRALQEKLMASARKLDQNDQNNGQNNGQQAQNGQYQNYNYNQQDMTESQFYAQEGTYVGQQGMEQGTYWNGNYWENEDGQYWTGSYWVEPDFDMTNRAFKYSGCAAIKTFDEEKAQETGNPMVIDTYAVFRLCPADSCNKYSVTGCGKDYGEYAVEMKTYLEYIIQYYEDRYEDYCDYCEPCDWEYQSKAKEDMQGCYDDLNQQAYQEAQQAQADAWNDYYEKNGGDMSGYNNGGQASAYNDGNGFNSFNQYYNSASQSAQGNTYNSASNGGGDYYHSNSAAGSGGQQQYSGGNNYANSYYAGGNSNAYNYNNQGHKYDNRKLDDNSNNNANSYNAYAQYNNANNNNGANANNNAQYNQNNANNAQNGNYDQSYWGNTNGGDAQQYGGYWGADGVWYEGGGGNYQMEQMYQCGGNTNMDKSTCDYCEYQNEQHYEYCDDYTCNDYYTYCSDMYGDDNEVDLSDFLECSEYTNDYDQTYYIGPHCGDDHFKISIGVFSDENCLNYIGETVTLASVLGFGWNDDDLFKLPKECISCDGTETYVDESLNNGNGRYGDYVSDPATTDDGVVAMCAALYESSAPCNQHLKNYDKMSRHMTQQEQDYEQIYCSFIDNIVYGAYDEQGEILLKRETFDFADWRNPKQYQKLSLPAGQAIGLAVSLILVVALLATVIYTHRSLTRQGAPWKPKAGPGDLSRTASGILMGRSRSGPNAAPLI